MAEIHQIDGTQLDPTSFGEEDESGVWRPKRYTGSYGTNGFYIKGDPTATNGIGHDHSGNGNNFTASGFTTSGTGTDVMSDTPTTNWCTLNPLVKNNNLSDGNLVYNTATGETAYSTFGVSSGKWYCEVTCNNANTWFGIGTDPFLRLNAAASNQVLVGTGGGTVYSQNSTNTYDAGATWTTGDVIGIALDADNGGCIFYKNNTRILEWDSFTVDGPYFFGFDRENPSPTTTHPVNFGQRAFAYTPPTGFKALNTSNLPAPTVKDGSKNMMPVLWTGTGSARTQAGYNFQPDLLWIMRRDASGMSVRLHDVVRGDNGTVMYRLQTNGTNSEDTDTDVTGLTSTGFTIGNDGSDHPNILNATYVGWGWKAAQNSGSSNTDGSVTSTVSVNATAGFSVVGYTAENAVRTVGHGLGVEPKLIIVKDRDAAQNWAVYHASMGNTKAVYLDTSAKNDTNSGYWNNTSPTSTVFSIGTNTRTGGSTNDYIAYCFAEVEGYSRISEYSGTGNSDGPYVHCGFRPSVLIIKNYAGGSETNWVIKDTVRDTYNPSTKRLNPNLTAVESDDSAVDIDFLSNGFKIRSVNNSVNESGSDYIFIALSENPFGGSGVSPATAR